MDEIIASDKIQIKEGISNVFELVIEPIFNEETLQDLKSATRFKYMHIGFRLIESLL